MTELLKHVEPEEVFIRRDSIMNFEEGCIVDFYGREGFAESVNRKIIGVRFLDDGSFKNMDYNFLHVKRGPHPHRQNNQKRAWRPQDVAYLESNIHLSSEVLAKMFGRTENAINIQKSNIKNARL